MFPWFGTLLSETSKYKEKNLSQTLNDICKQLNWKFYVNWNLQLTVNDDDDDKLLKPVVWKIIHGRVHILFLNKAIWLAAVSHVIGR